MKVSSMFKLVLSAVVVCEMLVPSMAHADPSTLDQIKSRGVLRFVTMSTIPPFAFKNEKGDLVGVDIDIAHLMAKEMFGDPTKVEFVTVSGDGRWPSVLSGAGDAGMATVYESRAKIVKFTPPVYQTGITLLVKADSPIKTLADVNKSGVTVAQLNNPQMSDRAKQFFPNATLQTFDQPSAEFLALRSGRVQAMQIDAPIADFLSFQNKGQVRVLDLMLGEVQHNSIFVRPGDTKWSDWTDKFVRDLTSGPLNREYKNIYIKWYGKAPPAVNG